mgnify:CR=1 FL=1
MHNKVVFRAASALNDAGLLVLRINFRGWGKALESMTKDEVNSKMCAPALSILQQLIPENPSHCAASHLVRELVWKLG